MWFQWSKYCITSGARRRRDRMESSHGTHGSRRSQRKSTRFVCIAVFYLLVSLIFFMIHFQGFLAGTTTLSSAEVCHCRCVENNVHRLPFSCKRHVSLSGVERYNDVYRRLLSLKHFSICTPKFVFSLHL